MKISEIPVKKKITEEEMRNGYVLGMKNIYPDDEIPVYQLQRFPISAFLSDTDMNTTKYLIKRLRNISGEITDKKKEIEKIVNNVQTIDASVLESADLQPLKNKISYTDVTSQLAKQFATPEELQTSVNNVYTELFKAIEDLMIQVFTTSMYARQYTPIIDDLEHEDLTTDVSNSQTN